MLSQGDGKEAAELQVLQQQARERQALLESQRNNDLAMGEDMEAAPSEEPDLGDHTLQDLGSEDHRGLEESILDEAGFFATDTTGSYAHSLEGTLCITQVRSSLCIWNSGD